METKNENLVRLFESTDEEGITTIREINENDISDITNSYGRWVKNSRFELDNSNFEANETGGYILDEDFDTTEVLELVSAWDLQNLTEKQRDTLIELSNYSIDNSDEADYSTVYEIKIVEDEAVIEEDEPMVVGKQYKYWDGHNWKSTTLSHDFWDNGCELKEVTEVYPNWDDKTDICNKEWTHGRRTSWYVMKKDEANILVQENETQWQGEFNDFEIIEDEEQIAVILARWNATDEAIEEHFPSITKKYGTVLLVTEEDFIFSKNDIELIESDNSQNGGVEIYVHKPTNEKLKFVWNVYAGSKNIWEKI